MVSADERIAKEIFKQWLIAIGAKISKKRLEGPEKQPQFAKRVNLATRTLSAIETGKVGPTGYGIDSLFRALYGAFGQKGLEELLSVEFAPPTDPHAELHRKLQELLDAKGQWPLAASVNVEAVYALYESKKPKP